MSYSPEQLFKNINCLAGSHQPSRLLAEAAEKELMRRRCKKLSHNYEPPVQAAALSAVSGPTHAVARD